MAQDGLGGRSSALVAQTLESCRILAAAVGDLESTPAK